MHPCKNKSLSLIDSQPVALMILSDLHPSHKTKQTAMSSHPSHIIQQPMSREKKTQSIMEGDIRPSALLHSLLSDGPRVVRFNFKPFSPQLQLYRKYPHHKTTTEGDTSTKGGVLRQSLAKSTPPRNIEQVYSEIVDRTPPSVKIRRALSKTVRTEGSHSNQDKVMKESIVMKAQQISMSGLVSHNFKSVKSKNRLAFSTQGIDQEMTDSISESKRRARASLTRSQKIHCQSEPSDISQADLEEAIASNYGPVSTDKYLKAFIRQKKHSVKIYGQPEQEYNSLKTMSKEVSGLEEACFMIKEIKRLAALNNHSNPPPKRKRDKLSGQRKVKEVELQTRRLPTCKTRVAPAQLLPHEE